jgi:hypothetical protein
MEAKIDMLEYWQERLKWAEKIVHEIELTNDKSRREEWRNAKWWMEHSKHKIKEMENKRQHGA